MPNSQTGVRERLESFREKMGESLRVNLRNHANCKLVIVTKRHPVSVIMEAYDCGERHFGESQAQEAIPKIKALPDDISWHFIGHLQKNKARKVLQNFEYIHSIDSLELLERVCRIASEEKVQPKVFFQVNLLVIPGRYGFHPEDLELALERRSDFERVDCVGLMGIPPLESDIEPSEYFQQLRELRDRLREGFPDWPGLLSMGMSGDYEQAIAAGSNLIRVGTRIMGARS